MRSSKPTIRQRAAERICPECGQPAIRKSDRGPAPTFCSLECKKVFGNRQLVEGRAVIAFLKAWRIDRGSGEIAQQSFAQVCAIVDGFNSSDRDAARPRADLYAAKLLDTGFTYMDREVRVRRERERRRETAEQVAA
jgi:endogenous inhibitor of DNA gyrase (YacG/DUF329 family)